MAFVSCIEIAQKSSGTPRLIKRTDPDMIIASDKGHVRKNGTQTYSMRITFSRRFARIAGLKQGDRLEVLFDRESSPARGLIRITDHPGGWLLEQYKKNKRFVTNRTSYEGMPFFPYSQECDAVTITKEGILFDLPKDHTFVLPKD